MCLLFHGRECKICKFKTDKVYKNVEDIIEVHHIEPLSELNKPKIYDPIHDLIPLCPNCHAAIHKAKVGTYTPDELKKFMKKND